MLKDYYALRGWDENGIPEQNVPLSHEQIQSDQALTRA